MPGIPIVELEGLRLASLTRDQVAAHVLRALGEDRGGWIITANVDHLLRHTSSAEVAALNDQADLIVADGMPLLWAARLQRTPLPERVAGSDLVWTLADLASSHRLSLYLLGGAAGAAEGAANRFRQRWPHLHIAGSSSPLVSDIPTPDELSQLKAHLEEARPDLVYVAFGAPKQERVIAALRHSFPKVWWVGVGISLGFVAGKPRRAPVWMQSLGLEWFHRFLQEPGRLTRRYFVEDLPFTFRLLLRAWRARH